MKTELPEGLKALILDLRQHPSFPALLKYMQPAARVPHYVQKDNEDVEKSRARWIFRSGEWSHYRRLYCLLTGETESPQGE